MNFVRPVKKRFRKIRFHYQRRIRTRRCVNTLKIKVHFLFIFIFFLKKKNRKREIGYKNVLKGEKCLGTSIIEHSVFVLRV